MSTIRNILNLIFWSLALLIGPLIFSSDGSGGLTIFGFDIPAWLYYLGNGLFWLQSLASLIGVRRVGGQHIDSTATEEARYLPSQAETTTHPAADSSAVVQSELSLNAERNGSANENEIYNKPGTYVGELPEAVDEGLTSPAVDRVPQVDILGKQTDQEQSDSGLDDAGDVLKISEGHAETQPDLNELKRQLELPDWSTRWRVVEAITQYDDPDVISFLKETLHLWESDPSKDGMKEVACGAIITVLAKSGDMEVIKPFLKGLKHSSPIWRRASAEYLGETGNIAVVPDLLESLNDSDLGVREAVIHALREITGADFGSDLVRWRQWYQAHTPTDRLAVGHEITTSSERTIIAEEPAVSNTAIRTVTESEKTGPAATVTAIQEIVSELNDIAGRCPPLLEVTLPAIANELWRQRGNPDGLREIALDIGLLSKSLDFQLATRLNRVSLKLLAIVATEEKNPKDVSFA